MHPTNPDNRIAPDWRSKLPQARGDCQLCRGTGEGQNEFTRCPCMSRARFKRDELDDWFERTVDD